MSSEETLQIAQKRFGVEELPASLAELVVQRAEGNALFVEEIARYLIERGTVRHTATGLSYETSAVAAALPASVELLLTARADRLSAQDRALLQKAAVIGRRFDPDLLAAIEDSTDNIDHRLEAMESLNFVQRIPYSTDSSSGTC